MSHSSRRFLVPALAVLLMGSQAVSGAEKKKDAASFGALEAPDARVVQAEAEAWAKKANLPEARQQQLRAIWKAGDKPLFDKVIDTLDLDAATARLLAEARNPLTPAPTKVPAAITDPKQPSFYRANLALAYAKALSNRRIYEEALAALKAVQPEDVADPAAYLFHRAVAEHAMLQKEDAQRSLARLIDEMPEAPERYKTVGALMLLDMLTWKPKDLNWIARKMDNSGRRLQLARGGPVTQKIQKDIVNRLDEIIKELENKQKGTGTCSSSSGGNNGQGGSNAGNPMKDSNQANNQGSGQVNHQRMKQVAQRWGAMPEKERRQFLQDLTKGMSDKHAQAVQEYFRRMVDMERSRRLR